VVHNVIRRAQRQGFVLPREIREELALAGVSATLWKDVLTLARPSLTYRRGRYYFLTQVSPRIEEEQRLQQAIRDTVRRLTRQYKAAAAQQERREAGRVSFIQPVQVHTADGRTLTLLSRDISTTGLRLLGTRSLLGQKVRVTILPADGGEPCCFLVRILWTCAVGDDLFENGGTFLQVVEAEAEDPPPQAATAEPVEQPSGAD
jgi:hypothetical protein